MALVLGTNSGFVTTAPTADPAGTGTTIDGSSVVTKHTSPADAVRITSIGWYRESGTNAANFEVALYSDVAGVPVSRLFVDNTNSTTSNGWVTVAVDWAISANTAYWLALQMDAHSGSSGVDRADSGGAGSDIQTSQTALNDPYGGGLVADADGMYAIYALVEVPVTGTGTPTAQAAAAAGSGASLSAGAGAPAAQAAAASGSGAAQWVASGAPAAQGATVAGAGISLSTGSGAPAAQAAAAIGSALSESAGSGAPAAQPSVAAGSGISESLGSGAPAAQTAAVSGAGVVASADVTGAGAPAAAAATASGDGQVSGGAAVVVAAPIGGSGRVIRFNAPRRARFWEPLPERIVGVGGLIAGSSSVSGAGALGLTRAQRNARRFAALH